MKPKTAAFTKPETTSLVSRYCCVRVRYACGLKPNLVGGDEVSAENANDVGDENQHRQGEEAGDQAGQTR